MEFSLLNLCVIQTIESLGESKCNNPWRIHIHATYCFSVLRRTDLQSYRLQGTRKITNHSSSGKKSSSTSIALGCLATKTLGTLTLGVLLCNCSQTRQGSLNIKYSCQSPQYLWGTQDRVLQCLSPILPSPHILSSERCLPSTGEQMTDSCRASGRG